MVFQFTPLREGRHDAHQRGFVGTISIHAPPRGATNTFSSSRRFASQFQFTPLREGRPVTRWMKWSSTNFNSRPSARGDVFSDLLELAPNISIHAPPRGATRIRQQHAALSGAFQFTPLREGRPGGGYGIFLQSRPYFNSRPSARGDGHPGHIRRKLHDFNSRPSARGDPARLCGHTVSTISIHAPPRGATKIIANYMQRGRFQFTPLREGRPVEMSSIVSDKISIHAPPRGATFCRCLLR